MTRATNARITSLMWLPMLAFKVPLGLWLLTRGVAAEPHASAGVGSA